MNKNLKTSKHRQLRCPGGANFSLEGLNRRPSQWSCILVSLYAFWQSSDGRFRVGSRVQFASASLAKNFVASNKHNYEAAEMPSIAEILRLWNRQKSLYGLVCERVFIYLILSFNALV